MGGAVRCAWCGGWVSPADGIVRWVPGGSSVCRLSDQSPPPPFFFTIPPRRLSRPRGDELQGGVGDARGASALLLQVVRAPRRDDTAVRLRLADVVLSRYSHKEMLAFGLYTCGAQRRDPCPTCILFVLPRPLPGRAAATTTASAEEDPPSHPQQPPI